MKRFGKYEKQPKVKSVLLQTYLTSLLCMVLCVAMFLGTTYAWFTSEVDNVGNEIYIGTLDVDLLKQIKDPENVGKFKDVSLAEKDDEGNNKYKLFDSNIRWEPGYTSLETIKIVNEGDLAFKYELDFIVMEGVTLPANVAKWFDVWVYEHKDGVAPTPAYYGAINAANGWVNAGTLADLLDDGADKVVLTGTMDKVRKTGADGEAAANGVTDGIGTANTYTIAVHMREDAGEDKATQEALMGSKIELNVKLMAYQLASEVDGFGNSNYDNDEITYASNLAELQTALAEGGHVVLADDIDAKAGEIVVKGGTFDGSEKTVSFTSGKADQALVVATGGTIKNVTVDNSGKTVQGIGAGMTTENPLTEDLYIENVTVYGAYYSIVGTAKNVKIVVSDSTLHGGISYPGASLIEVSDTRFTFDMSKSAGQFTVNEISGDTKFTNCSFDVGYCVNAYAEANGSTVEFTNCKVDGVELTAANFAEMLIDDKYDDPNGASSVNMKNCKVIVNGVEVSW